MDRFLFVTRMLVFVLGLYVALLLALGFTNNLNAAEVVVFTLVMLGPLTVVWLVFLVALLLRGMCKSGQGHLIVPDTVGIV